MREIQYIGISANLTLGAHGHFETFHKGIFKAFEDCEEKITYLGSDKAITSKYPIWYKPIIPTTMARPISWAKTKFIMNYPSGHLGKYKSTNYFIYEGNLAWATLQTIQALKDPQSLSYVNLFDSKKYLKVNKSRVKKFFFTIYTTILHRVSGGRLILGADTHELATTLEKFLSIPVMVFPAFSIMPDKHEGSGLLRDHKRILITIRGDAARINLFVALEQACTDCQYIIHGADPSSHMVFETKPNIMFTKEFQSETEYFNLFNGVDRCIISYSPLDFSHQSSGRFYDCVAMNIPVSVPANTSMAGLARKYGNSRIFDFESSIEIRQELNHGIIFSERRHEEHISPAEFVRKMKIIFLRTTETQTSRPKIKIFKLICAWYAYGAYRTFRFLGFGSFKLVVYKVKTVIRNKSKN